MTKIVKYAIIFNRSQSVRDAHYNFFHFIFEREQPMQQSIRQILAAFVACVTMVLGLGAINNAQAQYGPAQFAETYPDTAYVLPDEFFSCQQEVSVIDWQDRIVTFELYFGGSGATNNNTYFDGCESDYISQLGSLLEEEQEIQGDYIYRANWIAYGEGLWSFRGYTFQFNNNMPIGYQKFYTGSIGGDVLKQDGSFETFTDYKQQYIISSDGIRGDANGDGEVTAEDVEPIQLYCFSSWLHRDWRYNLNGINVGRSMILFSWPTMLDGHLIYTNLDDPNNPYGIGRLISETAYGNSNVRPAPYSTSQIDDQMTIDTDGQAVAIRGNLPDGTPWQTETLTSNDSVTFQLPANLQNIQIEAVYIDSATGINVPVEQPQSLNLEQNYPNPFNPMTTIDFDLTSANHVSLKVYNLNGDLVTTLADGMMSAGQHSIAFDGSALASGVYIYTLTTNGQSQSRKMILQK